LLIRGLSTGVELFAINKSGNIRRGARRFSINNCGRGVFGTERFVVLAPGHQVGPARGNQLQRGSGADSMKLEPALAGLRSVRALNDQRNVVLIQYAADFWIEAELDPVVMPLQDLKILTEGPAFVEIRLAIRTEFAERAAGNCIKVIGRDGRKDRRSR